ncbi:hypothetical protein [Nocardia flavorosea]|uniref:Uncharacterized protein n=1 Tax=Nocardia flavorosea TaxID=53429 RepID=A0A846Y8Z5_9NOCA|nr:hypothetical protein [Nocardia flavorosea]NKY55633.1 hypothetical protein [Nocardia flavorosea]
MSVPVLPAETRSRRLADFAFGPLPHRSAAELPAAGNSLEMWWRAVALGGTGHYAAARIALRRLRASTGDPVLLSLAASTEGSLRRQLGLHGRAAHDDGHAAALVLPRLPGASASGQRSPELIDTNSPGRYRSSLLEGAGGADAGGAIGVDAGADEAAGTGAAVAVGVAGDEAGMDSVRAVGGANDAIAVGAAGNVVGAGVVRDVDQGGGASRPVGVEVVAAGGVAGGTEHLRSADSYAAGFHRVPDLVDAAADALTGLAADALGTGRLALATRLLDRCDALLDAELSAGSTGSGAVWGRDGDAVVDRSRALVRLHWVRAETALAGGRADEALAAAESALGRAERGPSIRHAVKSRLLVAAAAGVTGDTARAAELAALVEEQCREAGLLPLRWACAMLRTGLPVSGVEPAAGHASATADAEACRALISRRGGRFRDSGR